MQDSVDLPGRPADCAARLRAEAVAMLSEQAALCSPAVPAPDDEITPDPAPPATARRPDPEPSGLPAADTAALLRELRALGEDVLPGEVVPSSAAVPARVRRGVFRRGRA